MIRRMLFGVVAALSVAGCDQLVDPEGNVSQALGAISGPKTDARFTALVRSGQPLLQISLVERDIQTAVVQETQRDGVVTWLSADGASLITQKNMLRGTRGLEQAWLSSDISQSLALVRSGREGTVERFHTYLDGEDQAVTRSYVCVIERRGPRETDLGARVAQTVLMRETCRSLDDEFFNLYWVEAGTILQTRQWAGPVVGAISTRVVLR